MRDELGAALLRLARGAIGTEFGLPAATVQHEALDRPGATFVTLKLGDDLRGCIGTLESTRPLRRDVEENARRAAFSDPRFPPLSAREFDSVGIEVSLLGPSEPIACKDEEDLLAQLHPGVDGLVLSHGFRRGTFLPQVWEALPEPRRFLHELKRKAGLPDDFWDPQLSIARYTVEKWTERDLSALPAAASPSRSEAYRA